MLQRFLPNHVKVTNLYDNILLLDSVNFFIDLKNNNRFFIQRIKIQKC